MPGPSGPETARRPIESVNDERDRPTDHREPRPRFRRIPSESAARIDPPGATEDYKKKTGSFIDCGAAGSTIVDPGCEAGIRQRAVSGSTISSDARDRRPGSAPEVRVVRRAGHATSRGRLHPDRLSDDVDGSASADRVPGTRIRVLFLRIASDRFVERGSGGRAAAGQGRRSLGSAHSIGRRDALTGASRSVDRESVDSGRGSRDIAHCDRSSRPRTPWCYGRRVGNDERRDRRASGDRHRHPGRSRPTGCEDRPASVSKFLSVRASRSHFHERGGIS